MTRIKNKRATQKCDFSEPSLFAFPSSLLKVPILLRLRFLFLFQPHPASVTLLLYFVFSMGIWACLLAMPCWWGPIRPKQLSTAANIQAHSFFKGFSTGLVSLTREAIVPYLVAVSLPARMCNTVIVPIFSLRTRIVHLVEVSEVVRKGSWSHLWVKIYPELLLA